MKEIQLSVKDAKIVKGKLEGKTSKQIAQEVYPDTKTGATIVRNRLQKVTLQDAVRTEMMRQGITLDKVIAPVTKALNAKTKTRVISKETITEKGTVEREYTDIEEDNIPLQLQGSDRASKWLGMDKTTDDSGIGGLSPEELQALASESDEMTLTQLVFKKG